jgi:hypothetical protein
VAEFYPYTPPRTTWCGGGGKGCRSPRGSVQQHQCPIRVDAPVDQVRLVVFVRGSIACEILSSLHIGLQPAGCIARGRAGAILEAEARLGFAVARNSRPAARFCGIAQALCQSTQPKTRRQT